MSEYMTCNDCDELLLDYFEGTLPDDLRGRFDEHVSSCARCKGLIGDIDGIREDAATLPELVPSGDLWPAIEARIQPTVVPMTSREGHRLSRRWLAAAAVALIAMTSGITYVATTRSLGRESRGPAEASPGQARVATAAPDIEGADDSNATAVNDRAGEDLSAPEGSSKRTARNAEPGSAPATPSRGSPRSSEPRHSGAALASASLAPATMSDLAFAGEISQLQNVLVQRRAQLDPETVKVVEDNLKLIDTAVKRARQALAKDPASGFLTRQLDNALQKKVELLRTVALLPAST